MKFTEREIKILELLAEGKKQFEIAEELGIPVYFNITDLCEHEDN